MANVWIERIYNFTNETFNLKSNDGTWRFECQERRKKYGWDEAMPIYPGDVLNLRYCFVPWADHGRLQLASSQALLDFVVGPVSTSSPDYLRGFDDRRNEVLTSPMGPRGGGFWAASVSLHLVLDEDPAKAEFTIWSANQVGPDILGEAGNILRETAPTLIGILLPK